MEEHCYMDMERPKKVRALVHSLLFPGAVWTATLAAHDELDSKPAPEESVVRANAIANLHKQPCALNASRERSKTVKDNILIKILYPDAIILS